MRQMYRSGLAALEKGDRRDAIRIFNTVLGNEPGFFQCRKSLHAARMEGVNPAKASIKRSVESVRAAPWLAKAEFYLHSHPARAIYAVEQALNHNPFSILSHKVLAKAALLAGLPRTALLSLNFLCQHVPLETDMAVELATAFAETGEISQAVATCGKLLNENPGNKAVNRLLKELVEYAKTRPLPPPAAPAIGGLKPLRTGPTGADALEAQISRLEALLQHGPNNHQILKRLGALYARKADYDRALEYYWRALQIAHGNDSESELAIQRLGELKKNETGGAASPPPEFEKVSESE